MDKSYIKFIIAYDYADKLEKLELACDEAYELAEKIADEYDEYTRENNIEQYYETLQEFCIDWFQNYSKQNTEFTKEEFCKITGFTTEFITDSRFKCILNAFNNSNESKKEFSDRFYSKYKSLIIPCFELLVKAKTTNQLEKYIFCNDTDVMNDVDRFFNKLFDAFCITFQ